jgi:endonuclease YncB( thermonuclease family)
VRHSRRKAGRAENDRPDHALSSAAWTGAGAAAAVVGLLSATAALADPCTAPVSGFRAGQTFAGEVRYVGDGDSICVSPSADPSTWIEVRIADFYAPELHAAGGIAARSAMVRIASGKSARCTAVIGDHGRLTSYDRVIAICRIGGESLGDLMRASRVRQGGNGWTH